MLSGVIAIHDSFALFLINIKPISDPIFLLLFRRNAIVCRFFEDLLVHLREECIAIKMLLDACQVNTMTPTGIHGFLVDPGAPADPIGFDLIREL